MGRLAAACAAVLFAACSAPLAPRDTVRIAIGTETTDLNPVISSNVNAMYFEDAIFDGLLKMDPDGRLLPDLATEVPSQKNRGISPDLRTFTYHLRHGVVWHDGAPFTAKDVAFTYRLLTDVHLASPVNSQYAQIAKFETPDAYTVRMTMKKPSISALSNNFVGFDGYIVPEHILARVADVRHAPFNVQPIGTGPYEFVKWDHGNFIQLAANPRYFGGAPHIAKIKVDFVPTYASRAELLHTDSVDTAYTDSAGVALLKDVHEIAIHRVQAPYLFYLVFNLRKPLFQESVLRHALADATDPVALLRGIGGLGTAADSILPAQSWAHSVAHGCRFPDLNAADDLLTKAGWVRRGSGARRRGSEALRLEIAYVGDPEMQKLAVLLQQQWKAIGIETSLHPYTLNVLFNDVLPNGRYEVGIDEAQINDPYDLNFLIQANDAGYVDSRFNRLFEDGDATADQSARRATYVTLQQRLCDAMPVVPLYWQGRIYGVNRRLRGFESNQLTSDLWNAATWSWQSK